MINVDLTQEEITVVGLVFRKMGPGHREAYDGASADAWIHTRQDVDILFEPGGYENDPRPRLVEMWINSGFATREWVLDAEEIIND